MSLYIERIITISLCDMCECMLYVTAYRENNYNKLVLAQHLDDLAESFLMSTLHNGQIRTMKAHYGIESGENIRVIRPFVYIREKMTKEFSVHSSLPVINENCPACFEQPKERARIKQLLLQEEIMNPALFHNLRKSLLPLMDESIYPVIHTIQERISTNGNRKEKCILSTKHKQEQGEIIQGEVMKEEEDDFINNGISTNKKMKI